MRADGSACMTLQSSRTSGTQRSHIKASREEMALSAGVLSDQFQASPSIPSHNTWGPFLITGRHSVVTAPGFRMGAGCWKYQARIRRLKLSVPPHPLALGRKKGQKLIHSPMANDFINHVYVLDVKPP